MRDFDLTLNRKSYGFEVDLKQYDDSGNGCDIYAAFFADRSSSPQIVKKGNSGLNMNHYKKHGNSWHSESLGGSHELPEGSPDHRALEMVNEAHNSL